MSERARGGIQRSRLALLGGAAALPLAMLLASSTPATAAGVAHPLAAGHRTVARPAAGSGGGSTCSAIPGAASYHNGLVANEPEVRVIYWGSEWLGSSEATVAGATLGMFRSLAGSAYQQRLSIYCIDDEAGGNVLAGYTIDTGSEPPATADDSSIITEIDRMIAQEGWPTPDTDYVYVVYLPPNIQVTSPGCGYHQYSGSLVYEVMPWLDDNYEGGLCDTAGLDKPGQPPTARETVISSHEYAEAVTDPFGNAFYQDGTNYEIGDLCQPLNNQRLSYNSILPGEHADNGAQSTVQLLWVDSNNAAGGTCEGESTGGYWLEHKNGSVSGFGDAAPQPCDGGTPTCPTSSTVVDGIAPAPYWDDAGYYETDASGDVYAFGPAASYAGDLAGQHLNQPIRAIAVNPLGAGGYWLVGGDGGIFGFGGAGYHGSCPASGSGCQGLTDIVGIVPTPDGLGYWLVGSDGGVFSFGDARFYGSPSGGVQCPVVAMASTAEGNAYWLSDACGNLYTFDGDYGPPEQKLTGHATTAFGNPSSSGYKDLITFTPTLEGQGYYFLNTTGSVWSYGDAVWRGSDAPCHCQTEVGFAERG